MINEAWKLARRGLISGLGERKPRQRYDLAEKGRMTRRKKERKVKKERKR